MIALILNEQRISVGHLVQEIFSGEGGIEVTHEARRDFLVRSDLDALLLSDYVAHELFGSTPVRGVKEVVVDNRTQKHGQIEVAEVISTTMSPSPYAPVGVPPWAIAAPTFRAHAEFDATENLKLIPNDVTLSVEEQNYVIFRETLSIVEQFNLTSEVKIHRLGCVLNDFGIPSGHSTDEMERELRSVQRAYHEYRKLHF